MVAETSSSWRHVFQCGRKYVKKTPPWAQENMVVHLESLWGVWCFRKSDAGRRCWTPHPLPAHHILLAELRFGEATRKVAVSRFQRVPLPPVWKDFVRLRDNCDVEREALSLAILLAHGAATFKPGAVAPAWTKQQRSTIGVRVDAGSAQETETDDEYFILRLYARVLDDLGAF